MNMPKYSTELKNIVLGLISTGQSFDVSDVFDLLKEILEEKGMYHDPIKKRELKHTLVHIFERGGMIGYCLTSKPMVDETGPFFLFEFTPSNPMGTLDLINKPDKDGKKIGCIIHPQYKHLIERISDIAGCTHDTLVRSLLIRSVNLIHDQLK